MPLDRHERGLGTLRISVTDRCNLRCVYCMPEDNYVWLDDASILSVDELARIAKAFVAQGVREVRLTGGEPLLQVDAPLTARLHADGFFIAVETNGTIAWDANPMQGPRLLSDKELAQTLEGADFYGNLLYPADRYARMENLGVVPFAGEPAYKVKLVRKDSGRETTQYFSVATALIIGTESVQESQMGTMQISSTLSEYKTFGGIKFPTKTEVTMGANKLTMTISEIVINGAPATAFDVPAAVQALIKK